MSSYAHRNQMEAAMEPESDFDFGMSAFAGMGNSFLADMLPKQRDGGLDVKEGVTGLLLDDLLHPRRRVHKDPNQAWSTESLKKRLDYKYEGADGKSLINTPDPDGKTAPSPLVGIMNRIAGSVPADATPEQREAFVKDQRSAAVELGALKGKSPEKALEEYDKFKSLQSAQEKRRVELGLDPIQALDPKHAAHMGSIQQLRSGSYVGQTLGVDDAYGALLNPTGGLVGEGNKGYSAKADSVASFHGEAHDAFGFLHGYHGVGPGYMYATPGEAAGYSETDPDRLKPFTGQASGFRKWNGLLEDSGREDPDDPDNPDAQMRRSLMQLGHTNLGRMPLAASVSEEVEDQIHELGRPLRWLM